MFCTYGEDSRDLPRPMEGLIGSKCAGNIVCEAPWTMDSPKLGGRILRSARRLAQGGASSRGRLLPLVTRRRRQGATVSSPATDDPRQAPEVPRRRCAECRHPGAHLTDHVRQARARPLTSSDGRMGRRSLRLGSWERWTKPEGELIESSERRTRLAVPKRPHGRGVVAAKAAFAPRQVTGPSAARFGLPTNGAVWRSSPRPPASSSGTGRPPFPSPSPR